MQYKYVIKNLALRKINTFYRNVSLKYPHTFTSSDMLRYVDKTIDAAYAIERSTLRRKPTIDRWQGLYMAHVSSWYFAYSIDGNTVIIHDACHRLNMR